ILHVAADGTRITVYPAPEADERAVALALVSKAATFALHQLGFPSLHASAVSTPAGAVVFLGIGGQGKSTMAAGFLAAGAAWVTDDVLPLHDTPDGVVGTPSLPIMKLWPRSATGALALEEELPGLTDGHPKGLLSLDGRYSFAQAPVRIAGVYVLDR